MKRVLFILLLLISHVSFGQKYFLGMVKTVTASCPYVLTMGSTTNWVFNAGDSSYKPVDYAGSGNGEGMWGGSISGDGYIQAMYQNDSAQSTAIFLTPDEAPVSKYYANVPYGLYADGGGQYSTAINGVYTGLGVTAANGDLFRVIRTGTTVKGQYYRSGTWTDLVTFTTGSTGSLFAGGSSAEPGAEKRLYKPKICY